MRYFYPRSPCGERPSILHKILADWGFLSTLSLRRATVQIVIIVVDTLISIHALLAESDHKPNQHKTDQGDFYPRSPCGERLPWR